MTPERILLKDLAAPFAPEKISWRVGSTNSEKSRGMALAYIDARDVMDRLNDVCGAHWQSEHIVGNGGSKMTCRIGIKIGDEWIWRSNGAGDTDVEADKGSYSDSFKRAAVMFGIGRYLYDVDSPWVELEPAGRSYKIKASEMAKLRALLGGKPAPKEAPEPKQISPSEGFALEAVSKLKKLDSVSALSAWADANKSHLEALPDDLKRTVRAAYAQRTKELTKEAA